MIIRKGIYETSQSQAVMCARCGEEISNERKVYLGDQALCLACAGEQHYYQVGSPSLPAAVP